MYTWTSVTFSGIGIYNHDFCCNLNLVKFDIVCTLLFRHSVTVNMERLYVTTLLLTLAKCKLGNETSIVSCHIIYKLISLGYVQTWPSIYTI